MGIPGLYRWLVDRYPSTLCCVAEERSRFSHGPTMDTTTPNPNGVEFDNLYIDMNGVIHPCFHPEGLPAPQSYDDVLRSIFRYIERVFSIVRPRKLVFLAVDGVAPRAKMNHQRTRRFRAAREREAAGEDAAVEEVGGIGKSQGDKKLDSNVITPGTEFMDLLSSALQYYVHLRMNSDSAWRKIKVVLSDSTVVGEGEHKILSYIRSQRNLPGYDPNTRHCFHGLDADLIMLALATHEIHISILREVITYGKHTELDSDAKYPETMKHYIDHLKFEFFNIWVLREYLERELVPNVQGTDFERLIDDFVLICLFVGNDFLPHLPSLDIAEGGIELLLNVYQEEFAKMGYLTNSSKVNLKSMEHFLQALSFHETAIFMKRAQEKWKIKRSSFQGSVSVSVSDVERHNKHAKRIYYSRKFDCERHDIDRIKRNAVLRYTEGVCWIMHYYYQGVCSWQWFYPYHYAPFASDFCGLDKLEIDLTLGQPLKPLDQLLAVLPAASAQALPLSYRELMTKESSPILDFYPRDAKIDRNGKKHAWQGVCKLPFIDESRLLSETVKVEHTLTAEERQRNRFGRERLFVHDFGHPLGRLIKAKAHHPIPTDPSSELQVQIDPGLSDGMNGYVFISDKPVCLGRIPSPLDDYKHVERNFVKSVEYKCPCEAPHVAKLLCGVKMPPKILRSQDSPPTPTPPVIWHAASNLSQPPPVISSTEESRKANTLAHVSKHVKSEARVEADNNDKFNITASSSTRMEHHNSLKPEKGKQMKERVGREAQVCETPEKQGEDSQPETRKKHKKRRRRSVEGEDKMNASGSAADKDQGKMIDEETRGGEEKTRNGIEEGEGAMIQKLNLQVGINSMNGHSKRKKHKNSNTAAAPLALGEDEIKSTNDFQLGAEKTKKKKKKKQPIVEEEKVNQTMERKPKKHQNLKDSCNGPSNHRESRLESDLQQQPVAESKKTTETEEAAAHKLKKKKTCQV